MIRFVCIPCFIEHSYMEINACTSELQFQFIYFVIDVVFKWNIENIFFLHIY